MDKELKKELKELIENDTNIVALYDYGSTVYGTITEKSDYDVIMIVKDETNEITKNKLLKYMDVNVFSEENFEIQLKQHEITPLECIFLDPEFIWKETKKWDFYLSLPLLRNAISAKSSNSWVKAKKKFIIEKDFNDYIGKKSAWHTLRILDFGTQIAKNASIKDYTSANEFLIKIMECSSWEEIDEKFKKIYNEKSSQFKIVAPKEEVLQGSKKRI